MGNNELGFITIFLKSGEWLQMRGSYPDIKTPINFIIGVLMDV
jgi:hypothetical protein